MASSKRNLGRQASKGAKKAARSTGNTGGARQRKLAKRPPERPSTSTKAKDAKTTRTAHAHDRGDIEVIARGVLIRGSRVLLCQSVKGEHWYLPGGHVEFGEPAATALRRELQEEAGLDVRVLGVIQVDEHSFDTRKRRHHELNIVFHVEPAAGTTDRQLERIRSREPGIVFAWVELAAVVDMHVVPMTAKALLVAGGTRAESGAAVGSNGEAWDATRGGGGAAPHGVDWVSAMGMPA